MAMHEDFEGGNFAGDPGLTPDSNGDSIMPGYRRAHGRNFDYQHEPMNRDDVTNICIDFGIATGMPTRRTLHGRGYDLVVPAEWVRAQLGAAAGTRPR